MTVLSGMSIILPLKLQIKPDSSYITKIKLPITRIIVMYMLCTPYIIKSVE